MKVKNVVKVMNFHALMRVDRARREAEKYFVMEQKLRSMIDAITNNMNLLLDKYVLAIDTGMPVLNIYIGSDMGFCGGYNFLVNEAAIKDKDSKKIIIGKKLWDNISNVVLTLDKDSYMEDPTELNDYLTKAMINGSYSEINIFYNEYVNASTIKWTSKRVYPFEFDSSDNSTVYSEDFVCETDLNDLLRNMVATYLCFEVMITAINSFASENVMRQNSTSESLKKIDEIEEENYIKKRKEISNKDFQKIIESYTKLQFVENK